MGSHKVRYFLSCVVIFLLVHFFSNIFSGNGQLWLKLSSNALKPKLYQNPNLQSLWLKFGSNISNPKIYENLNLQRPNEFAQQSDFNCNMTKFYDMEFPICVYTSKEDVFVSNSFIIGDYFERASVKKIVDFMKRNEDVTFIDIGANIGTYSLPVAQLWRHVIAVEPNWNTLRRFCKSVFLGGTGNQVDILHNAISDSRSGIKMTTDNTNRGLSVASEIRNCTGNCGNVSSIILDDILPLMRNKKALLKVDAEGSEVKIFKPSCASEFFKQVDVIGIQMEWIFYTKYYSGAKEKRKLVDKLLEFFYQRNYAAYNLETDKKLDSDWTKWPFDISLQKIAN